MPKVTVAVPHNADPVQVKGKAQCTIEKTAETFGVDDLQIEWSDLTAVFQFTSYRALIRGTVNVAPREVVVNVNLPLAAMLFKDRIRNGIADTLRRMLSAPAQ